MFAGPAAGEVADDPEAGRVLEDCVRLWESLPSEDQRRVSLASLPMDETPKRTPPWSTPCSATRRWYPEEPAGGFGLTAVEALPKARPVVASAVGGIRDQIIDGRIGLLLPDPLDLPASGELVTRALRDPDLARQLGEAGRQHAIDHYLGDTHLERWLGCSANWCPGRDIGAEDVQLCRGSIGYTGGGGGRSTS